MGVEYASLTEAWGTPASLKRPAYRGKREVENTYMKQPKMMVPNDNPNLGKGPQTNPLDVVEKFQSSSPYNFGGDPPTYASRANDYKLGCSMYGICSPVEGFQGQQQQYGMGQIPESLPGSGAGSGTGCESGAMPILGDAYSNQMQHAMVNSMPAQLAQNGAAGAQYTPPTNFKKPVDMSKVSGYYDEEIESYLQSMAPTAPLTNFMSVDQEAKGGQNITTDMIPFPNNNPVNLQPSFPASTGAAARPGPPVANTNDGILESINRHLANLYAYNPRQNWWDLAIYVLAGVLIIFLLEQLFQIAATIGMRRTITQLEPLLEELRALATQATQAKR